MRRPKLNEDDIKKLLDEYTKKYSVDAYYDMKDDWGMYDPEYSLMIKKKVEEWNYNPWGPSPEVVAPIYDASQCTYTEEERAEYYAKWVGALVKFAMHVGSGPKNPLQVGDTSSIDLTMTGAVFEISLNFKGQWVVQVLWANGTTTGENCDDLAIVQAPPGT